MSQEGEPEVLVVGAGPTGLMLAHELRCRGIGVRIIDENPNQAHESRALVVHARSLELLDKHGLATPLVARGRRTLGIVGHVEGKRDFEVVLGDIGVDDTPFSFFLFVSQAETERLLVEALRRRGTEVERGTRLDSMRDAGDHVEATLERRDNASKERVHPRFVVGCDGAHSTVRKQLGLAFEGAPYEQEFVLADVTIDARLAADRLHFFLTNRGILAAFPYSEPGFFRLIASRAKKRPSATNHDVAAAPDLREVQALADELGTVPIRVQSLGWSSQYRLHHRAVRHFRKGRAFLAGDAAHIHSPAGGQGMNTGLGDAANLAWKLHAVLHGRAGDVLLDSYEAERLPVARRLLEYTNRIFSYTTSRNPLLIRVRNILAPRLIARALASRERRQKAFRFVSQLAIRYHDSPVTTELGASSTAWMAGPRPGARAPDATLMRADTGEPTTLHAVLRGTGHGLIVFHEDTPMTSIKPPADTRCVIIERTAGPRAASGYETFVDTAGQAFRRYGVTREATYLVRPDGHVAMRAPLVDAELVLRERARLYGMPLVAIAPT